MKGMKTMNIYDITIIGGGPAGATLSRLLGKKYNVLLIDKRDLRSENKMNYREKSCGGLLAPDAQKMLAKMGLGLPEKVLVEPQIFAVRTIDFDNSIERYYQKHYININREAFDRWLISLIPDKVEIKSNSLFKSYIDKGEYVEFKYNIDGKDYTGKTKILVGADGGHSIVRNNLLGDRDSLKRYISIQQWFRMKSQLNHFCAIFDREVSDFYSWIIPEKDKLIVGAAIGINDDPNLRFDLLKRKIENYGFNLGNPIKQRGCFIARPEGLSQICIGKGNIVLIGESAGFISPSSAEGISYAFKSALNLYYAITENGDNIIKNYNNKCKGLKRNILLKNMKSPFMYNRHVRKIVMNSGLLSMKVNSMDLYTSMFN